MKKRKEIKEKNKFLIKTCYFSVNFLHRFFLFNFEKIYIYLNIYKYMLYIKVDFFYNCIKNIFLKKDFVKNEKRKKNQQKKIEYDK